MKMGGYSSKGVTANSRAAARGKTISEQRTLTQAWVVWCRRRTGLDAEMSGNQKQSVSEPPSHFPKQSLYSTAARPASFYRRGQVQSIKSALEINQVSIYSKILCISHESFNFYRIKKFASLFLKGNTKTSHLTRQVTSLSPLLWMLIDKVWRTKMDFMFS